MSDRMLPVLFGHSTACTFSRSLDSKQPVERPWPVENVLSVDAERLARHHTPVITADEM